MPMALQRRYDFPFLDLDIAVSRVVFAASVVIGSPLLSLATIRSIESLELLLLCKEGILKLYSHRLYG